MSIKLMSAIFETEFRDLQDADGNTTKASTAKLILLALADHANDEGEGAYPGLTKMERKTALSRQGIINTYTTLKHNGIINYEGVSKLGTSNYTINTKCFPGADGGGQPTLLVNPLDYPSQPALPEVVNPLDLNHTLTELNHPLGIKNKIYANLPVTESDLLTENIKTEAISMFEKAFGITKSWPWWSDKKWTNFSKWVVERYKENRFIFGSYVIWRTTPYIKGAMSNVQIRRDPEMFYDSWDMFTADKKDEPMKEFKETDLAKVQREGWVPAPERK